MVLWWILSLVFGLVSADKFLVIHPFYSGSHVLTLRSLTEQLIAHGHVVRTVRFRDFHNFKLKSLPNHEEIILAMNNSDGHIPFTSKEERASFRMPLELLWTDGLALSSLFSASNPWTVSKEHCHTLLGNKELIQDLKEQQFDVAIVDLIYNECSLALMHHLNVPSVGYWAFSFVNGEAEFSLANTMPSYVPGFMSGFTNQMDFMQRTYNLVTRMFFHVPLMWYHTYTVDQVISQYLPEVPTSRQLLADLSGILINTNNVLDYPRLQPQTYVNIGGMQIPKENGPLPKVIEDFISGADHGVILFSMGFIFDPSIVPQHRVDSLLQAFGRLPQRVIVKFDSPALTNPPSNVLVLPFIPQREILAHNKTILFFTHCGMHGVMEAIYYRVPMVGMPVFIDQIDVLTRMEEKGIGMGISKQASAEQVYEAIVKVRDDPRYQANIDSLSTLLKTRRSHPMDDALWLLELVSRTKGAKHLLPGSRHLNLIQYFSIDSMVFLVAFCWAVCKVIAITLNALRPKRKVKQKNE